MAAYVLERDRWREQFVPKSKPLATEEEVKQWLRAKDWRWFLEDDEAQARLQHLTMGIRDVDKKMLSSAPDIGIGDEILLIGHVHAATSHHQQPGRRVTRRGPEWVYEIAYRR